GGEVQPRVDGDAVPTDGDAGTMDVAVGLRIARLDDLVNIDTVGRGEQAELVRETDVHISVGCLGELGHLRRFGGTEIPYPVRPGQVRTLIELQHRFVELASKTVAFVRKSTDE